MTFQWTPTPPACFLGPYPRPGFRSPALASRPPWCVAPALPTALLAALPGGAAPPPGRAGGEAGGRRQKVRPGAHGDLGVRGALPRGPREPRLLPGHSLSQPGKGHPAASPTAQLLPFAPSSSSLPAAFPAALAGGDPSPVLLELPASRGGPSGQGLAPGHL